MRSLCLITPLSISISIIFTISTTFDCCCRIQSQDGFFLRHHHRHTSYAPPVETSSYSTQPPPVAVKPIPIAKCPGEKPAKPTPKKVSLILKIENDTSKLVTTTTTTTDTSEAGGGTRPAVKYCPGGGGGEGVADPAPAPVHSRVQGVEVAAQKIFVVYRKNI